MDLEKIFRPKTVALIGASETERSVGKGVMHNLLQGSCRIIPVNPKRKTVLGIPSFSDICAVVDPIDLAIIVTPAKTVPSIIEGCVKKGVKGAIIISSGFREIGAEGDVLEKRIRQISQGKMRIIGPNCLGVMNPSHGFNGTFAADIASPGRIAFISQSGALGTAVLDWSLREKVGFSSFVSVGSMVDVDFADLLEYFGDDPDTKSILIYMESIGNASRFLSIAKKVSEKKLIILIKAGRSDEAAKAAVSHTGALAGSDEVFSAALRRVGVLRVDTIGELFAMTEALERQSFPKGPCLTIVTNAGGPGVIATDALILNGGELAKVSKKSLESYNKFLPSSWSHSNPIDILGDASPEKFRNAVDIAINDPNTDGVLVVLTPQDMTDPTDTAKKLAPFAKHEKPILVSFMGAYRVEEGRNILREAGIPVFSFPDLASKTFAMMWSHADQMKELWENPVYPKEKKGPHKKGILNEEESKKLLQEYGIPVVRTQIAKTKEGAISTAKKMGFPIVLKLYSETITHKSDVGGVKLHLENEKDVSRAFDEIKKAVLPEDFLGVTVQPMVSLTGVELILGSYTDETFGPVVLFGLGGTLVEVFKDQAISLPALTKTLAFRLMRRTKIFEVLQGVRGRKGVDLDLLADLIVKFSHMICENRWIQDCDINPLHGSEAGFFALDARVVSKE